MGTGIEMSRRSVAVLVVCGLVSALALSVTAVSLAGKNKTRKLSGSTKSIEDGKKKPDPNGKVSMKVTARKAQAGQDQQVRDHEPRRQVPGRFWQRRH